MNTCANLPVPIFCDNQSGLLAIQVHKTTNLLVKIKLNVKNLFCRNHLSGQG